ncbi:hypothetical protein [Streptomyces sp. NPDC060065]|uniref:CBM96 family carbohydrate-binding protein n=1 Tax=Streptomyces sp. NPDC060065 TaxID=3347050 RepID=UPI0036A22C4E
MDRTGAWRDIVTRQSGGTLTVAESDPTHSASTITVQLVHGGTPVSADSRVTATQSSPTLTLTVDVSGAAGATCEAAFAVTSATLTARADGYVRDGSYAGTGYGTAATLVVKNATGTGYNRQACLTFDTSAVIGTVTATATSTQILADLRCDLPRHR